MRIFRWVNEMPAQSKDTYTHGTIYKSGLAKPAILYNFNKSIIKNFNLISTLLN